MEGYRIILLSAPCSGLAAGMSEYFGERQCLPTFRCGLGNSAFWEVFKNIGLKLPIYAA